MDAIRVEVSRDTSTDDPDTAGASAASAPPESPWADFTTGYGYLQAVEQRSDSSLVEFSPLPKSGSLYFDDYLEGDGIEIPPAAPESGRDWNREFQEALQLPSRTATERLKRVEAIHELSRDFAAEASRAAKTIVHERLLSRAKKTIKPCEHMGGVAGGEKFMLGTILFKYAWLGLRKQHDQKKIGQLYFNNEYAMKIAAHELKGASAVLSSSAALCVPLMAVIDYGGFRIVAQSIVPIAKGETILYGCEDADTLQGGATVHNGSADITAGMQCIASDYNLKAHWVGGASGHVQLHGPVDIEGHRGMDGRLYMLDCARLFPPALIGARPVIESGRNPSETRLFYMLRPEYLRTLDKPLSSDAGAFCFGPFGDDVRDALGSDKREVVDATRHLLTVVIPEFARKLNERELVPLGGKNMTAEMHKAGINVRYMGIVRSFVTLPHLRQLLLTEMIVRVSKNLLRREMRSVVSSAGPELKKMAAHRFNLLLGTSAESHAFVTDRLNASGLTLKDMLSRKFDNWFLYADDELRVALHKRTCLSSEEEHGSLRPHILPVELFLRLQESTGLRFSKDVQKRVMDEPALVFASPTPFAGDDIECVECVTRRLGFTDSVLLALIRKADSERPGSTKRTTEAETAAAASGLLAAAVSAASGGGEGGGSTTPKPRMAPRQASIGAFLVASTSSRYALSMEDALGETHDMGLLKPKEVYQYLRSLVQYNERVKRVFGDKSPFVGITTRRLCQAFIDLGIPAVALEYATRLLRVLEENADGMTATGAFNQDSFFNKLEVLEMIGEGHFRWGHKHRGAARKYFQTVLSGITSVYVRHPLAGKMHHLLAQLADTRVDRMHHWSEASAIFASVFGHVSLDATEMRIHHAESVAEEDHEIASIKLAEELAGLMNVPPSRKRTKVLALCRSAIVRVALSTKSHMEAAVEQVQALVEDAGNWDDRDVLADALCLAARVYAHLGEEDLGYAFGGVCLFLLEHMNVQGVDKLFKYYCELLPDLVGESLGESMVCLTLISQAYDTEHYERLCTLTQHINDTLLQLAVGSVPMRHFFSACALVNVFSAYRAGQRIVDELTHFHTILKATQHELAALQKTTARARLAGEDTTRSQRVERAGRSLQLLGNRFFAVKGERELGRHFAMAGIGLLGERRGDLLSTDAAEIFPFAFAEDSDYCVRKHAVASFMQDPMENAHANLAFYGEWCGLDLTFDEEMMQCAVTFQSEYTVTIAYEMTTHDMCLWTPVCDHIPRDRDVCGRLYRRVLKWAQLNGEMGPRGGVGILPSERQIIVHRRLDMSFALPTDLQETMADFTNCVERWRNEIYALLGKATKTRKLSPVIKEQPFLDEWRGGLAELHALINLRIFGTGLNMHDLSFNENNECGLTINQTHPLVIKFVKETCDLQVYSTVCRTLNAVDLFAHPERRFKILEYVLLHTLFGRDVAGGSVGLNAEVMNDQMVIHFHISMNNPEPTALTMLSTYVDSVNRIRTLCDQLVAGEDVELPPGFSMDAELPDGLIVHRGLMCSSCRMTPLMKRAYRCVTCRRWVCTACEENKGHDGHVLLVMDREMSDDVRHRIEALTVDAYPCRGLVPCTEVERLPSDCVCRCCGGKFERDDRYYRCLNCVSFDVCFNCGEQDKHGCTHVLAKVMYGTASFTDETDKSVMPVLFREDVHELVDVLAGVALPKRTVRVPVEGGEGGGEGDDAMNGFREEVVEVEPTPEVRADYLRRLSEYASNINNRHALADAISGPVAAELWRYEVEASALTASTVFLMWLHFDLFDNGANAAADVAAMGGAPIALTEYMEHVRRGGSPAAVGFTFAVGEFATRLEKMSDDKWVALCESPIMRLFWDLVCAADVDNDIPFCEAMSRAVLSLFSYLNEREPSWPSSSQELVAMRAGYTAAKHVQMDFQVSVLCWYCMQLTRRIAKEHRNMIACAGELLDQMRNWTRPDHLGLEYLLEAIMLLCTDDDVHDYLTSRNILTTLQELNANDVEYYVLDFVFLVFGECRPLLTNLAALIDTEDVARLNHVLMIFDKHFSSGKHVKTLTVLREGGYINLLLSIVQRPTTNPKWDFCRLYAGNMLLILCYYDMLTVRVLKSNANLSMLKGMYANRHTNPPSAICATLVLFYLSTRDDKMFVMSDEWNYRVAVDFLIDQAYACEREEETYGMMTAAVFALSKLFNSVNPDVQRYLANDVVSRVVSLAIHVDASKHLRENKVRVLSPLLDMISNWLGNKLENVAVPPPLSTDVNTGFLSILLAQFDKSDFMSDGAFRTIAEMYEFSPTCREFMRANNLVRVLGDTFLSEKAPAERKRNVCGALLKLSQHNEEARAFVRTHADALTALIVTHIIECGKGSEAMHWCLPSKGVFTHIADRIAARDNHDVLESMKKHWCKVSNDAGGAIHMIKVFIAFIECSPPVASVLVETGLWALVHKTASAAALPKLWSISCELDAMLLSLDVAHPALPSAPTPTE